MRDPRVDPRSGDMVKAIPQTGFGEIDPIRVQAVIGNLVAYTVGLSTSIEWVLREKWCEDRAFIRGWEVLHVAVDRALPVEQEQKQ